MGVHLKERHQEFVEYAIPPPVSGLELTKCGFFAHRAGEYAIDRTRCQQRTVGCQVNARRKYWVHKTCRIADENHARTPELCVVVGVVFPHPHRRVLATGYALGIRQVFTDQRALFYQAPECLFLVALNLVSHLPADHGADTGQFCAERNIPEPATIKCDPQDVSRVWLLQPLAVLEI